MKRNFAITKKLLITLILIFLFIFIDAIFQKIFGFNLFGTKQPIEVIRISSIFGDEYIMGTYVIKFYPIIIGLIYFYYKKNF